MYVVRTTRGNTLLELAGDIPRFAINGKTIGAFAIAAEDRQRIWKQIAATKVPIALGDGRIGTGGTRSEVAFSYGATHLAAGWWMAPPEERHELAVIFEILMTLVPQQLTARYGFARRGE